MKQLDAAHRGTTLVCSASDVWYVRRVRAVAPLPLPTATGLCPCVPPSNLIHTHTHNLHTTTHNHTQSSTLQHTTTPKHTRTHTHAHSTRPATPCDDLPPCREVRIGDIQMPSEELAANAAAVIGTVTELLERKNADVQVSTYHGKHMCSAWVSVSTSLCAGCLAKRWGVSVTAAASPLRPTQPSSPSLTF